MKQAILITAYKNFSHLLEIIHFFDDNFQFYIHWDKKAQISKENEDHLRRIGTVKFLSRKYKVNWGGVNHLKCILHLSEKALENKENFFFHLISGHDFPIKDLAVFTSYFKENKRREFIEYFSVPKEGWADNGGLDRIEYYNLYDIYNAKNPVENKRIRKLIDLQKYVNLKRKIPARIPQLYGGSTWWSLSRECLSHVVVYNKTNKFLLRRFQNTLCSEEFYFQTVIMNSRFAEMVQNDNLRHIDWVARNNNNPAVLDESDYPVLLDSHKFFARKFDYPVSKELLLQLKEKIQK